MKKITVQFVKIKNYSLKKHGWHDTYMLVIDSNHKRFTKGTRFDYGFLNIAIGEGYIIEMLPVALKTTLDNESICATHIV